VFLPARILVNRANSGKPLSGTGTLAVRIGIQFAAAVFPGVTRRSIFSNENLLEVACMRVF